MMGKGGGDSGTIGRGEGGTLVRWGGEGGHWYDGEGSSRMSDS